MKGILALFKSRRQSCTPHEGPGPGQTHKPSTLLQLRIKAKTCNSDVCCWFFDHLQPDVAVKAYLAGYLGYVDIVGCTDGVLLGLITHTKQIYIHSSCSSHPEALVVPAATVQHAAAVLAWRNALLVPPMEDVPAISLSEASPKAFWRDYISQRQPVSGRRPVGSPGQPGGAGAH